MVEDAGEESRYVTLVLSQAEFEFLTHTRILVQVEMSKELTWPEFVLALARRVP